MKNKTIFVAGGNDGIGKVTAMLFAKLGANVAIMGRRKGPNEAVAAEIEAAGGTCFAFTGDVTKEGDRLCMKHEIPYTCSSAAAEQL